MKDKPENEVSEALGSHLWRSVALAVVLLVVCCGIYPVVVWGLSQAIFPGKAGGSLVSRDGTTTTTESEAVGSAILGQNFSAADYFHPRPSAAGAGYDAASSSGSNLGPLSDKLINGLVATDDKGNKTLAFDGVRLRTLHYAIDYGITFKTSVPLDRFKDAQGNLDDVKLVEAFHDANAPLVLTDFSIPIPGDAVTASGSGLDPHISPRNAELQASRVAQTRGITIEQVKEQIAQHTDRPDLGVLGDPGVNVLMLNLALDAKYPIRTAPAR